MPSARKTQAICSRKIVMRSNGSRYSSEKIVIHRSNFSGYPFKELLSVSTARTIRSKILSAVILFQTTFTPSSETQGQSESGQVKLQVRCKGESKPLGTDSHQTISKRSSECWLQKLSSRFLPTQLTATKNFKSFSFLYNLVLYSFLIFFLVCIT